MIGGSQAFELGLGSPGDAQVRVSLPSGSEGCQLKAEEEMEQAQFPIMLFNPVKQARKFLQVSLCYKMGMFFGNSKESGCIP